MILTGHEIRRQIGLGNIEIDPFVDENIGPNSVDLRLANTLRVYDMTRVGRTKCLDMKSENNTVERVIPDDGLVLYPGTLYLGSTIERTHTDVYVPKVEGRSSVGRLGMKVHLTAGFGDLGFNGNWTLEIEVVHPLRIYAGVRVCQVYFSEVAGEIERLYRGRYQGDTGPAASRFHQGLNTEAFRE